MSIQKLRFSIWVFLIGVILSSCSAIHPLTVISPTQTYTPRFVTVDCAGYVTYYQFTCGYLVVPEDRLNPDSRIIRLGVAMVKTQIQNSKPDPIVFIYGAPNPGIVWDYYLYTVDLSFPSDRDFIFFDQRGAGLSVPDLNCLEVDDWYFPSLSMDPSSPEYRDSLLAAHHACHDRLVKSGVNLSAYTTAASVADLVDLRIALGYPSWNIYSMGYGAGLALELMQQDPTGTRSVFFDSALPLQVDTYTEMGFNAEQGFNLLFIYCAEDPVCNSAYPDLKSTFFEVVDQLNAHPVRLDVPDLYDDKQNNTFVNGDRIIKVVLNMLPWVSNSSELPKNSIPRLIYQIHNNQYDVLKVLLTNNFLTNSYLGNFPDSTGMSSRIYCNDVYRYSTLEKVWSANSRIEPRLAEYFNNESKIILELCEIWSDTSNAAVIEPDGKSSVPILVQAGDFDWGTPTWMVKRFTDSSTNSYDVEYQGAGGLIWRSLLYGTCSRQIMNAFLNDPYTQLDITCSKEKKNQLWALP